MAKNVKINNITYSEVSEISIPLATGSGTAEFFDTSDATATSGGQLLSGATAYANGVKLTGTIATKESTDLTASGATVTAPAGYYAEAASKSVASGSAKTPATTISDHGIIGVTHEANLARVSTETHVLSALTMMTEYADLVVHGTITA